MGRCTYLRALAMESDPGPQALVTWLFLVCLVTLDLISSGLSFLKACPGALVMVSASSCSHLLLTVRKTKGTRSTSPVTDPSIPIRKKSKDGKGRAGSQVRWERSWGHPSLPSSLQAAPSICGSSSWHFCKTEIPAPSTSSGPSERKASSSWWIPKLCPSYGGSRKTNLT